ncbi:MAG: hypothetical protein WBH82_02455 [Arcanobacterium sp.]
MLDPTLNRENLAKIAAQGELLTDERLAEIAAHPVAWESLIQWAGHVRSLPLVQRADIPVPDVPVDEPEPEPVKVVRRRHLPRPSPRLAAMAFGALGGLVMVGVIGWKIATAPPEISEATTNSPAVEETTPTPDVNDPLSGVWVSGAGFYCQANGTHITCGGRNDLGQLGTGLATDDHYYTFKLDDHITAIDSGTGFTCASTHESVTCWGDNAWRQAADSDTTIMPPTTVPALNGKNVTSLAVGNIHACAVADAQVYCWGSDYSGQLGTGSQGQTGSGITVVDLPADALSVVATDFTTCASLTTGEVLCWGANDEHRINASEETILAPTLVPFDE